MKICNIEFVDEGDDLYISKKYKGLEFILSPNGLPGPEWEAIARYSKNTEIEIIELGATKTVAMRKLKTKLKSLASAINYIP